MGLNPIWLCPEEADIRTPRQREDQVRTRGGAAGLRRHSPWARTSSRHGPEKINVPWKPQSLWRCVLAAPALTPVAPNSTESPTGSCCRYGPVSVKGRSVQKGSGSQTVVCAPVPRPTGPPLPSPKATAARAGVGLPSSQPGAHALRPAETPRTDPRPSRCPTASRKQLDRVGSSCSCILNP